MPQFDTFSFSSQLFWVFFSFFCLYFALTYYLLPAISVVLKIRKRKLINYPINNDLNASSVIITQGQEVPIKTVFFDNSSNLMTLSLSAQNLHKLALNSSISKTVPLSLYSNIPNMLMI